MTDDLKGWVKRDGKWMPLPPDGRVEVIVQGDVIHFAVKVPRKKRRQ